MVLRHCSHTMAKKATKRQQPGASLLPVAGVVGALLSTLFCVYYGLHQQSGPGVHKDEAKEEAKNPVLNAIPRFLVKQATACSATKMKFCALVLSHGSLAEPHSSDVTDLMRQYGSKINFGAIDTVKHPGIEWNPAIVKPGEPSSVDDSPILVLLRRENRKAGKFTLYAGTAVGDLRVNGTAGALLSHAMTASPSTKPNGNARKGKWGLITLRGPPQGVADFADVMALYNRAQALIKQRPGAGFKQYIAEDEAQAQDLLMKASGLMGEADELSDTEKELQVELNLKLGNLVEWQDQPVALRAYAAAQRAMPNHPEANLKLAGLRWKTSVTEADMAAVEQHLRAAIKFSRSGENTHEEAIKLLARLLSSSMARAEEAHEVVRGLGFTHTFARYLLRDPSTLQSQARVTDSDSSSKQEAAKLAGKFSVNAFDTALPPRMLAGMREGFALDAPFWRENDYDSPDTGFISFQHQLPAFPPQPGDAATGLDAMLQHVWQVAAAAVPAVQQATHVEWWAHARQHSFGHAIHYDSLPSDERVRYNLART